MLTDRTTDTSAVMFLLDVDNTLLDNDRFGAELGDTLAAAFGEAERQRYWSIYEELRQRTGFADYLGALQRFRSGLDSDPALLRMSAYLLDYPFAKLLYPDALETVAHLGSLGRVAILSDGDVVFQPRKIHNAGLWAALRGEVLVYVHKQHMLVAVQSRYPAAHYVMIDDKPQILAEMKQRLGGKLTTVFVQQGRYAAASAAETIDPPPDLTVTCIGELRQRKLEDFLPSAPVIPLTSN
ncbi:MAG TPA: HAD family hydrolase [Rhodanobacter sp.]